MLQGMETEINNLGGLIVTENSKYSAHAFRTPFQGSPAEGFGRSDWRAIHTAIPALCNGGAAGADS
jgi:hypothetical protein